MNVSVVFKLERGAVQRLLEVAFQTGLAATSNLMPAPDAAAYVINGGMVTVYAPTRNSPRPVAYGFDLGTVQRGLAILFTRYPAYIAGVMASQAPGPVVGNVFLQCCLYGEVIDEYSAYAQMAAVPTMTYGTDTL